MIVILTGGTQHMIVKELHGVLASAASEQGSTWHFPPPGPGRQRV